MKRAVFALLLLSLILLPGCNDKTVTEFTGQKLSYTKMRDPERNIIKIWKYKYNFQGEVSTSLRCAKDGTCVQRNEYTYTDSGLKSTETIYLLGEKALCNKFTYDDEGKLLSKNTYTPEGFTKTAYSYLPDGRNDFDRELDEDGNLIKITYHLYDELSKNKIKEQTFDKTSKLLSGIDFTYEDNLLIKKEYIGNSSEEFSREEYTYDGENIVTKVFFDKSGNLIYKDFLEYDHNGCSKQIRYDKDGNLVYTWTSHYADFITLIG